MSGRGSEDRSAEKQADRSTFCPSRPLGALLTYVTTLLNLIPGGIPGVSCDGCRILETILNSELSTPLHLRGLLFLLDKKSRQEAFASGHALRLVFGYGLGLLGAAAEVFLFLIPLWPQILFKERRMGTMNMNDVFCKSKIQKVAKKNTESCTVFSTQLRQPVW